MSCEPIAFPILFRFGRSIVASRQDMVRYWHLKHLRDNTFSYAESIKLKPQLEWIIDSYGLFRKVSTTGYAFERLRSLRYIWRFTRVICEIAPGERLTAGEILKFTQKPNRDPEKSTGPAFPRFLKRLDEAEILTEQLFLEFMREPIPCARTYYPKTEQGAAANP